MSASEKLRALERLYENDYPNYVLAALPQIVAVVEAAEDGREFSLLLESNPAGVEMMAWPMDRAQKLHAALSALDEALTKTVHTPEDEKA